MSLVEAVEVALQISSEFEGNGSFSNIVGNFDGAILTCGSLGWTWKFGDQQKMVLDCEKLYPNCVNDLMPTCGKEYLELCSQPIHDSSKEVVKWSDPVYVLEPYKSDLESFWKSPQMIEVQVIYSNKIGAKAFRYAQAWQKDRAIQLSPTLQQFCFFFDLVVNNGSLLGLTYRDVKSRIDESGVHKAVQEVTDWCTHQGGECAKNGSYWQPTQIDSELLILGWLRALKSHSEWQGTVMNRRGILAVGSGYIQGSKKNLLVKFPHLKGTLVIL